tara:strand:+ start:2874 stop:3140 length:267 start_codon:yes stop_codon:yes gene_type:complete
MTQPKNKIPAGTILTTILILFSAGTAWGVSNVQIQENRSNIEQVEQDLEDFEVRIDGQYAEMSQKYNDNTVMLAQIANDILWLKENQQ